MKWLDDAKKEYDSGSHSFGLSRQLMGRFIAIAKGAEWNDNYYAPLYACPCCGGIMDTKKARDTSYIKEYGHAQTCPYSDEWGKE